MLEQRSRPDPVTITGIIEITSSCFSDHRVDVPLHDAVDGLQPADLKLTLKLQSNVAVINV